MPKIYTYLGITILFYSNEHEPVHVFMANVYADKIVQKRIDYLLTLKFVLLEFNHESTEPKVSTRIKNSI